MSFDGEQVFYADQNLGSAGNLNQLEQKRYTHEEVFNKFKFFIKEWTKKNTFIYRNQLIENAGNAKFFLRVELDDINNFDMKLGSLIITRPLEFISDLEKATKETYLNLLSLDAMNFPDFQVQIISDQKPKPLRILKSDNLGHLITVKGIVVSANKIQVKAKILVIQCRNCRNKKSVIVPQGIPTFMIPKYCDKAAETGPGKEKCPPDCYYVVSEECTVMDQQTLKLQENPETIPTGEIPRTFQIFADRYLVGKLIPGTRVTITGIYTVIEKKQIIGDSGAAGLKLPYIIILGFEADRMALKRHESNFSLEEESKFIEFSKNPNIYEKISQTIASGIYGSDDIKKAIACLLFGGSRKLLPDKTKLRGDINILLIGDPSTAKSQFLKFVER